MVDKLIACNGVYPRCQRLGRIVGMAPVMNCHQRILHKILRLRGAAADARKFTLIVRTQDGAELTKQGAISNGVAAEARLHQRSEFSFVRGHVSLSLLFVCKRILVTIIIAVWLGGSALRPQLY